MDILSKDYILSLIQKKGWSKAYFTEKMMGVKKQNLDALLKTKNINTIIKLSEVLDIPVLQLIGMEPQQKFEGFVKKDGEIKEIRSEDDILKLVFSDKTLEDLKLWKKAYEDSYNSDFSYERLVTQMTASVEDGDPNVYEMYCRIKVKVVEDKENAEEQKDNITLTDVGRAAESK